ncbi:MAG: copper-translocating P-type ATPase [Burkholderiales bacterium RIFCSPLOWO2_02_FULL_57_36]|nr:MAG: copper-translocating P-type ATPase [Burkholderiales bacterium RIFCSPLOWO2_02_FULL_57_36]
MGEPGQEFVCNATDCFHCGEPLPHGPTWPVTIGNMQRPTCCPGCQAVAQTIFDTGLADYYLTRTALPATSGTDRSVVPPELMLYDEPDAQHQFAADAHDDARSAEATLSVEGIRCAACVWLIERRLARLDGIEACHMNVATGRLNVRWNKDTCKPSDILLAIRDVGYTAYPFDAARQEGQLQRAGKILFRQLFIAGLSMMQVMMYAVPAYLADDGAMDADMDSLMRWASLLLTLPALLYSAQPFFKGAWSSLRKRALGMDVPVALGIAAAFVGSAVATWCGQGEVYFDTVTMFIFLLLCSRYLELAARRKAASSLQKLSHAMPSSATRVPEYPAGRQTETVAAARLVAGDVILVKPGEAIPADGTLIEGDTSIDVSLLTGESRPQTKAVGEVLPGGAVNTSQAIFLHVIRPVADSTLAALVRLIEHAGQAKPQIALWADKVAAWFVASLLLFAAAVFVYWMSADPQRAWPIAIAVLVVSCPCALSLATPSALAAATDFLVRRGVLIVRSHVLETLHRATHIVFDKTGTLTVGKPTLQQVRLFSAEPEDWVVNMAAALEASSAHPLGAALVDAAKLRGAVLGNIQSDEVRHTAGQGLEGVVDGMRYRLGRAAFVAELSGSDYPESGSDEYTSVYLGTDGKWLARFDLADAVRDDAQATIAYFRAAGKAVILLSGDHPAVTQRVADGLGIDIAYGACLPEEKLLFVQELQRGGAVVAMVGDGINDAAVLRAADVSFAMGSGAMLAQTHADAVLLSGRLDSVREAALTASATMAVIWQNLAWATLYNVIAIPAAALGWLNPWMSGIGMSVSSAVVVVNALRLRRMQSGPRSIDRARLHSPACARAKQEQIRNT